MVGFFVSLCLVGGLVGSVCLRLVFCSVAFGWFLVIFGSAFSVQLCSLGCSLVFGFCCLVRWVVCFGCILCYPGDVTGANTISGNQVHAGVTRIPSLKQVGRHCVPAAVTPDHNYDMLPCIHTKSEWRSAITRLA